MKYCVHIEFFSHLNIQSDPMEPGGGGGPYDIEEINTENADHTSLSGMNNLNHQNSTDNQNNMSSYSGNPFTPDFMRQNSNPNSNVVVKAEARELENGNSNGQYGSNSLSHQNMMDSAAKICIVCHDRASGKHYGVYSCEGCKVTKFLLSFSNRKILRDFSFLIFPGV